MSIIFLFFLKTLEILDILHKLYLSIDMTTLGRNVRRLRMQHGLSQRELCVKCDTTSISMIETGKVQIAKHKTMEKLAKIFNVTIADLLTDHKKRKGSHGKVQEN